MGKFDPNQRYSFEFDEQWESEISEQIMNAYNSGFIDQGTYIATKDDFSEEEE
ncbi:MULTISPECIES: hypothetical protein [Neobacillus]|jgi:hypothetical protein|uniref:Uncharacterized protein n=1 Tax=Neobacillus sedimentimangrovi TaxID=2699460 RepID=A0ABS8QLR7_9BACI|nr:hypothetical protein [Neobacillus sedimentimangrovi]MCD4840249.1 hypothetical protein [Neobacillus sedimentimangrovi]